MYTQNPARPAPTAEEIIKNFLSQDIDPLDIERLHNDMLLHYLRPTNDWNLSRHLVSQAIDCSEILTYFLRQLGELKQK